MYETTLRDHLGFRKNLRETDWEAIGTHLEMRKDKQSEVTFWGDRLNDKKLSRVVKRHHTKMSNFRIPTRSKL